MIRSSVLAQIHSFFFKIYLIKEVTGPEVFPSNVIIENLLEIYLDLWPYTFPEFIKSKFVDKLQAIFMKKFIGEDLKNNRESQKIKLDFNFGREPPAAQKKSPKL